MQSLHQGHNFPTLQPLTSGEISSLPERPEIDETVLIIGTGIAGCATGWALSEAGYKVGLVEQLDKPFSSTSIGALGIHLGGRYPRDWETATECLQSGIMMKKLMSFAFSDKKLRFLTAEDSPLDFDSHVEHYARLQEYYAQLPPEDQVFGEPEDFFRILDTDELEAFTGISGGIETQETCFNMDQVRTVLLRTLMARGALFLTSTEVRSISKNEADGAAYKVVVENTNSGAVQELHAETVVNAAGPQTRAIGQELEEMPRSRLDLRFFQDIKIDEEVQEKYPFPFVVMPGYMHYVPLGEGVASLVGFAETIDTLEAEPSQESHLPNSWREQLAGRQVHESEARSAAILDAARERFMPHLGDVAVEATFPGVAVSFNSESHIKKQLPVEQLPDMPNYYRINPTKASHAIGLALEVTDFAIAASTRAGRVVASDYLADILSKKSLAYIDGDTQ